MKIYIDAVICCANVSDCRRDFALAFLLLFSLNVPLLGDFEFKNDRSTLFFCSVSVGDFRLLMLLRHNVYFIVVVMRDADRQFANDHRCGV